MCAQSLRALPPLRAPVRWLAAVVALTLACLAGVAYARAAITVYFYDPGVAPKAPAVFERRINSGLRKAGADVAVKAFSTLADLQAEVRDVPPDFVMVPPYVAAEFRSTELEPLLIRQRRREISYEVVIVGVGTLDDLDGGTLAASGNAAQAAFLNGILLADTGLATGKVRVLEVGKDLDAVLAAGRGQTAGACASPKSVELVRRANPAVGERLKVLHAVADVPHTVLYGYGRVGGAEVAAVREAFGELHKRRDGRRVLKELKADRFVPIDGELLKRLER